MESVAHLLVMLNSSSNFLIYCSVSNQFKEALSKHCFVVFAKREREENKRDQKVVIGIEKDITVNLQEIMKEGEEKESGPTNCETHFDVCETRTKF